jgi:hypothetical protein
MVSKMKMPRYKCHKEVFALKVMQIEEIISNDNYNNSCTIIPEAPYEKFTVDGDYRNKHNPVVGGYYVLYDDGYESFSPQKAFEDGYTLIPESNIEPKIDKDNTHEEIVTGSAVYHVEYKIPYPHIDIFEKD